jgi:hypothetical protein
MAWLLSGFTAGSSCGQTPLLLLLLWLIGGKAGWLGRTCQRCRWPLARVQELSVC